MYLRRKVSVTLIQTSGERPLFLIRSLVGKVVSLAVVLLVVAGVGWYFFIREDNEVQKEAAPVSDAVKQAAAASPTTAPVATTGAAASPTAAPAVASTLTGKNYKFVDGQSLAWYLAPEKLSRLPTSSVAKGQTSDVKGEFHLTADGLNPAKATKFTVGVASLKSEEGQRDGRMRDALETTKFPTATFTATKLTGMPKEFTATDTVNAPPDGGRQEGAADGAREGRARRDDRARSQ